MESGQMPGKKPTPLSFRAQSLRYLRLIRFDRPIGTLLLLWPTLWSLWLAADGIPQTKNLIIFVLGVFLMRSAGCVINDLADRHVDGRVTRTKLRPLATGEISVKGATILFLTLITIAFILVLQTNSLTIALSCGAFLLACTYPFMKRHTYLPQVVLGAAFAWSIPMAYAAETASLSKDIWLLYFATLVWTVAYDTIYAMADREDDINVGIKSTAILFGESDKLMIAALQALTIIILILAGKQHQLNYIYHLSLVVASILFIYQQHLIRERQPEQCIKAFLNNQWVGLAVFLGICFGLMTI